MRIVITQSNYFPWRGWFALARSVDELVLYDSVQYTKRDWRNRNRLFVGNKLTWLTVPVATKGQFDQKIQDVLVSDPNWHKSHIGIIREASKSFGIRNSLIRELDVLLESASIHQKLSDINLQTLKWCFEKLSINTTVRRDEEFKFDGNPSERLAKITVLAGATTYVSGTAARAYLDVDEFTRRGLTVDWVDYSNLPVDKTLLPEQPEVSILGTLLRHELAECIALSTFNLQKS